MAVCSAIKLTVHHTVSAQPCVSIPLGSSPTVNLRLTGSAFLSLGVIQVLPGPVSFSVSGASFASVGLVSASVGAYPYQFASYAVSPTNVEITLKARALTAQACPVSLVLRVRRQVVAVGLGYRYPMGDKYVFTQLQSAPRVVPIGFDSSVFGTPLVRGGTRYIQPESFTASAYGNPTLDLRARFVYSLGHTSTQFGTPTVRLQRVSLSLPSLGVQTIIGTVTLVSKRRFVYPSGAAFASIGGLSVQNKRRYVFSTGFSPLTISPIQVQAAKRYIALTGRASDNHFGLPTVQLKRRYVPLTGAEHALYGVPQVTMRVRSIGLTAIPSRLVIGTILVVPGMNVLRLTTVPSTYIVPAISVQLRTRYIAVGMQSQLALGTFTAANRNKYVYFTGFSPLQLGAVAARTRVYPVLTPASVPTPPSSITLTYRNRSLYVPSVSETLTVSPVTLVNRLTRVILATISPTLTVSPLTLTHWQQRIRCVGISSHAVSSVTVAERAHRFTFAGFTPYQLGTIRVAHNPPVVQLPAIDDGVVSPLAVTQANRYIQLDTIENDPMQQVFPAFLYAFTQRVTLQGIPYPCSHWVFVDKPVFDTTNGVWTTHKVPESTYQDFADGTLQFIDGYIQRIGHIVSFPASLQTISAASLGDTSFVTGTSYPEPYIDENGNWVLPNAPQQVKPLPVEPQAVPPVQVYFPNQLAVKSIPAPQLPLVTVSLKNRIIALTGIEGHIQPNVDDWFMHHALRHPNKLINTYVYPQCEWRDLNGVYRFTYWNEWDYVHDQVGKPYVNPQRTPVQGSDALVIGDVFVSHTPIVFTPASLPPPDWPDPLIDYTTFLLAYKARTNALYQDALTPNIAVISTVDVRYG